MLLGDRSLALVRASSDRLFESVPHWLYEGDTPLHLAAAVTHRAIVAALLAAGADAAAVNRRGATPLHYACDPRPNTGSWDPDEQAAVIDLLVRAGAPVNIADLNGATALHRAVRARGVAAVQALLAHGADANARSPRSGATPLHLALTGSGASGTAGTKREQQEIVVALVNAGASVSAPDGRGKTALDLARTDELRASLRNAPGS